MDKKDFFHSLGLSEYESKSLASLIRLNSASPKEISIDSGVPQNKLYAILKNLEKEGILSTVPGKTQKYKAINLKAYVKQLILKKKKEFRELQSAAKSLEKIKDSEEEFVFSIIRGQRAIMNKIAEQNRKTKHEIIGVQRNWKVWGEGLRAMKEGARKGVKVRMVGVINKDTENRAKEWKKTGCNIRAYNEKFGKHPLRFTIFDNEVVRLTIGKPEIPDPKDYITIWTKSPALINALRSQFEAMWKDSEVF